VPQLTTAGIPALAPGKYHDGNGLYLRIRKSALTGQTNRSWLLRYMLNSRAREMGLGSWPTVSLQKARQAAQRERVRLKSDRVDPLAARRSQASSVALSQAKRFREVAKEYIAAHEGEWGNPKHRWQWTRSLEKYAYPKIGDLPVAAIDTDQVLRVLTPVWHAHTVTATRLRARLEEILGYAMHRGYRPQGDNPARWESHLKFSLAKPSKIAPKEGHPALPYEQLPAFFSALREQTGIGAKALAWAILNAVRVGDVTGQPGVSSKPAAMWSQIDLKTRVWTHPTKTMKEHRVPLSEAAIGLLEQMEKVRISPFIFPGATAGLGGLGEHGIRYPALVKARKSVPGTWLDESGEPITIHGFRATFSTWITECTSYPWDLREAALAHAVKGVAGDYQRGDLLEKRRELMDAWARFATRPQKDADRIPAIIDAAAIASQPPGKPQERANVVAMRKGKR
jgi:integrase